MKSSSSSESKHTSSQRTSSSPFWKRTPFPRESLMRLWKVIKALPLQLQVQLHHLFNRFAKIRKECDNWGKELPLPSHQIRMLFSFSGWVCSKKHISVSLLLCNLSSGIWIHARRTRYLQSGFWFGEWITDVGNSWQTPQILYERGDKDIKGWFCCGCRTTSHVRCWLRLSI